MLISRTFTDAAFAILSDMQKNGYSVGSTIPAIMTQAFIAELSSFGSELSLEKSLAFIQKMEEHGVR